MKKLRCMTAAARVQASDVTHGDNAVSGFRLTLSIQGNKDSEVSQDASLDIISNFLKGSANFIKGPTLKHNECFQKKIVRGGDQKHPKFWLKEVFPYKRRSIH